MPLTLTDQPFKILAISGSLRAKSSNTTVLQALAMLAPADVSITLYAGLADLPYFNPDLDTDTDLPSVVRDFRALIGTMDAIAICSPEYAHGMPGVLKNALDWLVGSTEFPGKAVALINASTRSTHAYASLTEVLKTMSANLVVNASLTVPIPNNRVDEATLLTDAPITALLTQVITALVKTRAEIEDIKA